MDKFVTVTKSASLRISPGSKGTCRYKPYDKNCNQRQTSSAATKHLLSTLSDDRNPITHPTSNQPIDHVHSVATGHQRRESRCNGRSYFEHRTTKLAHQAATQVPSQKKVLKNVHVYINGFLSDTTDIEMKRTVTLAGGVVLQTPSGATHILTSQGLSGSKTQTFLTKKSKNIVHVVKPEWVMESIKAGKRLPERNYAVIHDKTTLSLEATLNGCR